MDISAIPFNKYLGVATSDNGELSLSFTEELKNHIGSFHASAQFALAEACSGLALQRRFNHLTDKAVPVLRRSEIKFTRAAQSDIVTRAHISETEEIQFLNQLEKKGRATITVSVEVIDAKGNITMKGTYGWFVQIL